MLRVLDTHPETRLGANGREATVMIAADTRLDLEGPTARQMAIEQAGKMGMSDAGISSEDVYPVDNKWQEVKTAAQKMTYLLCCYTLSKLP